MTFRFLIKRAFKSLFSNKLFIALMSLLMIITSATYTMFESSSSSFKASYNQVVNQGKLHDLVIKENFQIAPSDEVQISSIRKTDGSLVALDGQALQANATPTGNPQDKDEYTVTLAASKTYSAYGFLSRPSVPVTFSAKPLSGSVDWDALAINVATSAKGIIESQLKARLATTFVDNLKAVYSDPNDLYAENIVDINTMNALSVTTGVNADKVVKYNSDTNVNKMIIYDGTDQFINPLSAQAMNDELTSQMNARVANDPNLHFGVINNLKGFKATVQDNLGQVLSVTDAAAYQAIVSPTYANENNKVALPVADFLQLTTSRYDDVDSSGKKIELNFFDAMAQRLPELVDRYQQNIFWVDQMPFFITGIGITPDFAYPIIDEKHPTIDPAHQAIVYVSPRGYERTLDSFRTNPQESYISLRFHNGISKARQADVMKEIEQICRTGMSNAIVGHPLTFPKNMFTNEIHMVTRYDDPNDQMTLTQERVAFLNKLQSTISTVSSVTTSMLAIFVSVIVAMVFGVLISANRKSLATLLALGYTKLQIACSTAFIALLIGALPALVGYLIGFGSQYLFINTFSDFWTIPAYGHTFSWLSLLITAVLPTIPLFFLIAAVTFGTLSYPIPSMLKDSVHDNSWIVAKIMAPLRGIGIKTKYAIALTLRNSGKLLLVSATAVIAAVALMVGIATVGQARTAFQKTAATVNYEYKVDLYSPTTEGGLYSRVQYGPNSTGQEHYYTSSTANPQNTTDVPYYETYNPGYMNADDRSLPHWHVPGAGDKNYALPLDPQAVVDQTTVPTMTAEIAHYLKNKIQTRALIDTSINGLNPWSVAQQLMPDNQINTANTNFSALLEEAKKQNVDISTPQAFMQFIDNPLVAQKIKPYIISYNTIVTDANDEVYTYIDANLDINNQQVNQHVTGLSTNTAMYKINHQQLEMMNTAWHDNPNFVPVIINKYAAANDHLSVGSVFDGTVNNDVDRNFNDHTKHNVNFRVVAIMDGYNDTSFITTQTVANAVIGLDAAGFNGVMSRNHDATMLGTLPLYSPSGMYFATDTLVKGSVFEAWLNKALSDPNIWNYGPLIATDFDTFVSKYSSSPLVSMVDKVDWRQMNELTFMSVSHLTSSLIDVVEGISIGLSIIFTIIVITLIIKTNRKRIATLWTIGYRKKEIVRIFMTSMLLPIICSLAIGAPLALGLLVALREFIMHFGHILIPFTLAAWIPFVVAAAIFVVYGLATTISIRSLSSAGALEAFKEE